MATKLKNRDIVLAVAALKAMPTLKKAAKGVYGLAKSLHVLSEAQRPIIEANTVLFKEHFGDAQTVDQKHPKYAEFQAAARKVDETETEVTIHQITQADLNLAENEVHHDHLAAISFLISDW